jgi:hypothetical protein
VAAKGYKEVGEWPQGSWGRVPTLAPVTKTTALVNLIHIRIGLNLIHGPLGQNRVTQHHGWKGLYSKSMITVDSEQIWRWFWILWKVDLIRFPGSTWTTKMESGWSRGGRHKLCLSCSPNPACTMPLPFWSNPLFLSKTRVHMSPLSKYDEPELKSELTWWVSWRARARVIGPSGIIEIDTCVGVDVSLVAMSSSSVHHQWDGYAHHEDGPPTKAPGQESGNQEMDVELRPNYRLAPHVRGLRKYWTLGEWLPRNSWKGGIHKQQQQQQQQQQQWVSSIGRRQGWNQSRPSYQGGGNNNFNSNQPSLKDPVLG